MGRERRPCFLAQQNTTRGAEGGDFRGAQRPRGKLNPRPIDCFQFEVTHLLKQLAATTKEDSPANPKASQGRNPQEGGSQGSKNEEGFGATDRSGPSGGGSPPKAGGGKSGGGGGT